MANDKYFEQISDYLDGLLQAEEQEAFEAQLKIDKELKAELELYREIQQELRNKKVSAFRKNLQEINEAKKKDASPKVGSRLLFARRFMFAAAAILVLIAASIWFFFNKNTSETLLSEQIAQLDPSDILPAEYSSGIRSVQDSTDLQGVDSLALTAWHQARTLFAQKAYDLALREMRQVTNDQIIDLESYYYELGILQWLNNLPVDAINTLEKMETDKSGGKQWFLALSYLAMDDFESCREELSELSQKQSPWSGDATSLLNRLP